MSQLSQILYEIKDDHHRRVFHYCPGCKGMHPFDVAGREGGNWTFNEDLLKPTFTPSMLIKSNNAQGDYICHSFTRDGKIQFLPDSTHELSGFTVDIPPLPEYWTDKEK